MILLNIFTIPCLSVKHNLYYFSYLSFSGFHRQCMQFHMIVICCALNLYTDLFLLPVQIVKNCHATKCTQHSRFVFSLGRPSRVFHTHFPEEKKASSFQLCPASPCASFPARYVER